MTLQDATKAELHLRTDELRQRLCSEVEKQSTENLAQLEVRTTSWPLGTDTGTDTGTNWRKITCINQAAKTDADRCLCQTICFGGL